MVKGFDTTKSDPSKLFLDYLFTFSDKTVNPLSPKEAHVLILDWIKNSVSTSEMYRKFESLGTKPKIIIEKYCKKPLSKYVPYNGDENFGAYSEDNNIHVCLNSIKNKMELKENLDRELRILETQAVHKINKEAEQAKILESNSSDLSNANLESISEVLTHENDMNLINSLYKGCLQGYQVYGWDENVNKRLSKKCAIYLFRRRAKTDLPPDSLFRYASHLADSVIS